MRYNGRLYLILTILLFICASPVVSWAQTFGNYSDVTEDTGIDEFSAGSSDAFARDGAAVDFDKDGKLDLLMGALNVAWRQEFATSDGVPVFTDWSTLVFEGSSFPISFDDVFIKGFIIGDYDNDGYTDVFVPAENISTGHQLYRCDPSTNPPHYENVTADAGLHDLGTNYKKSTGGAWVDYDADGFLDLMIICPGHNQTIPAQFLLHNVPDPTTGGRKFVNVNGASASGFVSVPHQVSSVLWADYDGDHDMDLMLVQTDGYTKYFLNTGSFLFDFTQWSLPTPVNNMWDFENHASTIADIDNDGSLDIAYIDKEHIGYVSVQVSGGTPVFGLQWSTSWSNAVGFGPSDIAPFDYELDGKIDIISMNFVRMYRFSNDARGGEDYTFETLNDPADPPAEIGYTGNPMSGLLATDFVEDGLTELFVGRRAIDPFFYKQKYTVADTPPTNWAGIRLESIDGLNNFHGIGATVTLSAGTHTQAQIVDGGTMNGQQRGLGLTFGLGSYSGSTAVVEVKWPGGQVQNLVVPTGQYTTITEGASIVVGTVDASTIYHLDTFTHDWVFECDIVASSDLVGTPGNPNSLEVDFQLPIQPSSCTPEYAALSNGSPANVTVTSTITSTGWHYKLVWADTDCLPNCYIPFRISFTEDLVTVESETHNLRIKTCLGGL